MAYYDKIEDAITRKLFIKFLKKIGEVSFLYSCFHRLSSAWNKSSLLCTYLLSYSYLINTYIDIVPLGHVNDENHKNFEINSQLWRFYVLGNLREYPENMQPSLRNNLRKRIKIIGDLNNEKLKQLFELYQI